MVTARLTRPPQARGLSLIEVLGRPRLEIATGACGAVATSGAGRLPPIVLALLLLPAGCTEPPATDEGAQAWLQVATETAMRIDGDARLLGIAGLEAEDAAAALAAFGDPPAWMPLWARDDRGPGDGKAPAWLYAFLGTGDPVYVVVADGRVVFAEHVDEDTARRDVVRLGAPGAWSVDAPAARAALVQAGAMPELPVLWQLAGTEDGGAAWRAVTPGTTATHEVDAVAGTVREVVEDEPGGAFADTVTLAAPEVVHDLVKEGDDGVRARIEIVDPLPMTLVELRLVDPDGVGHAVIADGEQGGTATLEAARAPEGTWEIGALLVRGVAADVRLAWCTFEDDPEGDEAGGAGEDPVARCRAAVE